MCFSPEESARKSVRRIFAEKAKAFTLVAGLVAVASSPLAGQSLLVSSAGTGFETSFASFNGSYNVGYEFSVGSSSLSVSALGFYDVGGISLADSHQVGLWTATGDLLATATVPSGVNTLLDGFAFQTLTTPVTLSANTNYVLGAYWPTTADRVYANTLPGTDPAFSEATLVGSRVSSAMGATGFAFPSQGNGADGVSWIGANLEYSAIPEPSAYAAILGAVAFGFAAVRRRRKVA